MQLKRHVGDSLQLAIACDALTPILAGQQTNMWHKLILLLQDSFAWNLKLQRRVASLIQFPRISNGQQCVLVRMRA